MTVKEVLKVIKLFIEELWTVAVLIWNLPVGIIEIIWEFLFEREEFNTSIKAFKNIKK